MPGWLFSVGGWIEGCVDTVQGCCGDSQELWMPQGVIEHPVVGTS